MNSLQYNFTLLPSATILSSVILSLAFIASISSILIAFYYEPAAGNAYQSLAKINQFITNGWVIYSIHDLSNGIIESISVVRESIRNLLTGGSRVNTTTIAHFYTLHSYVLSVVAIALVIQKPEQKGLLVQQLEKLIAPISSQLSSNKVENVGCQK